MPYYNGRKFVSDAIQSVLSQTYKNIEIIVVNDASPDRQDCEYIQELADEFGFKLIAHSRNEGIGRTLADAFEASRGEFIAELSQDDLYKPEKIEKQINELTSKKLDVVYTAGDVLYQSTGKIESRSTAKAKKTIESGAAAEILKRQNLSSISIQGLLAKRCVFEKDVVPIWRDYLLDDWPVNIRLFERYRVGFIEEPLWTGRAHTRNTSRNIWKWLGPQIEVVARMAQEHLKVEGIGNRLISMARRLHKQNGNKEDIICLAFAGLMLVDSPDQYKKGVRVLDKIPRRDKKAITSSKLRLLESARGPAQQKNQPEGTGSIDWKDIGREIADAVGTYQGNERLQEMGKVFSSLADSILLQNQSQDIAGKTAIAALMLIHDVQDETRIAATLRSLPAECKERLIKEKCLVLKVGNRLSLKSLILK
jgi:glycosyltransferase involved in cell wall biosynthesis